VYRFEPRPRGAASSVASTPPRAPPVQPQPEAPTQFLVEQPPRELERARRQLLDQWASIEGGGGLESSTSWGATSGWARYEPRNSPTPQPAPSPVAALPPSAPPVFGGAALERRDVDGHADLLQLVANHRRGAFEVRPPFLRHQGEARRLVA
jgi:hypothetical protein